MSVRGGVAPFSAGVTFRYDTQRSAPALWAAFAAFQTARFGAGVRFDQLFVPNQVFDRDVYGGFARNLPAAAIGADDLGRWGGGGNLRQGIDALVGSPVPAGFRDGQRQSAITLDARVSLVWGLGLTYSGTLYPGATWTLRDANGNPIGPPPDNTPTTETAAPKGKVSLLGQQNFGISFRRRRAIAGAWTSSAACLLPLGSTSSSRRAPAPTFRAPSTGVSRT